MCSAITITMASLKELPGLCRPLIGPDIWLTATNIWLWLRTVPEPMPRSGTNSSPAGRCELRNPATPAEAEILGPSRIWMFCARSTNWAAMAPSRACLLSLPERRDLRGRILNHQQFPHGHHFRDDSQRCPALHSACANDARFYDAAERKGINHFGHLRAP